MTLFEMTIPVIIGNCIMLAASIIMVSLGLLKTRKQVLVWQTIQFGLNCVGALFLGSIPGFLIDLLGVGRNLLVYYGKINKITKAIIIVLSVCLPIAFNNIGWLGLFPVIAAVLYTIFMDTQDTKKLKFWIMVTLMLWAVHDFGVQSYVSCVFDIFSICTSLIGIFRKDNPNGNSINQTN